MKPCRHLDYEDNYTDCQIRDCAPHFPDVRYWERGPTWTEGEFNQGNPVKVQFCKLRGHINGIFQCYNGEMSCYEPRDDADA